MRFRLVCQSCREPQAGYGYPFAYGDTKLLTLPRADEGSDLLLTHLKKGNQPTHLTKRKAMNHPTASCRVVHLLKRV